MLRFISFLFIAVATVRDSAELAARGGTDSGRRVAAATASVRTLKQRGHVTGSGAQRWRVAELGFKPSPEPGLLHVT